MIGKLIGAAVLAGCWWSASAMERLPQSGGLVPIHVAVSGGIGVPLGKDDFELTIDGNPAAIASVTPPPTPLTVVLLLDRSISMETYGDIDEEIAKSFASALQSGDRARVGGIANKLVLAPAFSSNPKDVVAAGRAAVSFRREDRFGPSPIWDAVDQALTSLDPEKGLRAIILVTDGRATGNTKSIGTVADHAVYAGVVIDVLSESLPMIIRQSTTSAVRVRPGLPLEQIARATGGSIVPEDPKPDTQLPQGGLVIRKFVEELRAMYTLGVAPVGPSGSVHRIDVRVKRPGLTARTRGAFRTG